MIQRIILILSVWGCVSSLNAQSLIGVTLDPDMFFLYHILEMDLADCTKKDTIVSYFRPGGTGDLTCGPDSNFYAVHGGPEKTIVRVDRETGIPVDLAEFPFPMGGNVTAMAFRPNGDLILGANGSEVRFAVYNIYTRIYRRISNFTLHSYTNIMYWVLSRSFIRSEFTRVYLKFFLRKIELR